MNREIDIYEKFSTEKVKRIREALAGLLQDKLYSVVVGGSYARKEASPESDLDYFVICDSDAANEQAKKYLGAIKSSLKAIVEKDPAAGGAFGDVESISTMDQNIGGQEDVNSKITRRILFLLEGEWLYDEKRFLAYRERIVKKYITTEIGDHQFCRFLLNDLIRYYRTICVDFEHKTQEEGKAWGTRNIKLIFSRKLLYFSGVLVAAETWHHPYDVKIEKISRLLSLTPIQRIQNICGDAAKPSLDAYGDFLKNLGAPETRRMLEAVTADRMKHPPEFRRLKNDGHHFTWKLAKLLKDTYDESHPIHTALVV